MVQAINRIHSQNTIVTHTDDCFYIYNNELWKKSSSNYYKYYDTDISNLDISEFNNNDYIISYKTKANYIKFSESFKDTECKINGISQWNICGLSIFENDYRFPNTGKNSTKFQTNNKNENNIEVNSPIEHSINQSFLTKPNELYVASCMVKNITSSTHNLALQLFDDTYNVGVTIKFNLNDDSGYDNTNYKDLTENIEYLDSNFSTVPQSDPILSHIDNVGAGIYKITNGTETYFRLVIKCSCDFNSLMKFKLLILNNNSEFKYTSKSGQEKYIIWANAFQLEKNTNLNITKPSEYMITTDRPSIMKIFDKMYKINNNHELDEINNKLYYIYNIKEYSEIIPGGDLVTYLKSFKPSISNPKNGDIAIVPSLISFSPDINYQITRTFDNYSSIGLYYNNNRKPTAGQIILVKNDEKHGGKESLYQYKGNKWTYILFDDCVVKFGDKSISQNPDGTLSYDLINSKYKIKNGDGYKTLSYISDEKNRKSMVKAMTFNQGYFETWCKQDRGDSYRLGYNTGGGFNYHRLHKFFPKKF